MPIRVYKPTSPGRRNSSVNTFSEITKSTPEKSLLTPLKKTGGRNNRGVITTRHRGGGHKRKYRIIDFKRNKNDIPARVSAIEYDPNRSANIALLFYADGEKRYIIAPKNIKVNDKVISGENAPIKIGNAKKLKFIPVGTIIHNIEMHPGKGGQIARSAGTSVQILNNEGKYTLLKLSSGEMRLILSECMATIGEVGNSEHNLVRIGKAGRSRWMGRRPTVRGSAMNPNDHPHGGGESRSPIGRPSPVSPWGMKTLGKRTRNPKKASTKLITRRRK